MWPLAMALAGLNFALPYSHVYGHVPVPMVSMFSPPPETWVMPFRVK